MRTSLSTQTRALQSHVSTQSVHFMIFTSWRLDLELITIRLCSPSMSLLWHQNRGGGGLHLHYVAFCLENSLKMTPTTCTITGWHYEILAKNRFLPGPPGPHIKKTSNLSQEPLKDLKISLNGSQMHLDTTHEETYTLECLLLKIFTKYYFWAVFSKFMLFSAVMKNFAIPLCRM